MFLMGGLLVVFIRVVERAREGDGIAVYFEGI